MSAVNMLGDTSQTACRLCMSNNSTMHDIFTNNSNGEASIATQVIWLTQLTISIDDGLPTKACSRCIVQLNAALDFINQCTYSDEIFRGMVVQHAPDEIPVIKQEPIVPETDNQCEVVDTAAQIKVEAIDVIDDIEEETFNVKTELTEEETAFADCGDYHNQSELNTTHIGNNIDVRHHPAAKKVQYQNQSELNTTHIGNNVDVRHHPAAKSVQRRNDYHNQSELCSTHQLPAPKPVRRSDEHFELTASSSSMSITKLPSSGNSNPPVGNGYDYECEFCGRSFTKKMSLASHVKRHTRTRQLKQYGCAECGLSFTNKVEQAVHNIRHTGVKPFPCQVCEKGFSRMDSLRKHMRIHTKERPYKCTMCPNVYSQKWTLRLHERRHLGVKPHQCEHCGRAFCDPSNLRTHTLRKHTSGKPVKKYNKTQALS